MKLTGPVQEPRSVATAISYGIFLMTPAERQGGLRARIA
jgi:hypothetical protein